MARSPEEIRFRCKVVLSNKEVLDLVAKSSSPTAAYEMIMAEFGNIEFARAGRWLAILRRDHSEEYQKITSNQVALQQHDKGEENENERTLYQKFAGIIKRRAHRLAGLGERKKETR